MSIGKNIQHLRISHGLLQRELADIAGVSSKTVSAWEKDRIIPRMGPIQKIADYFGIKKSDIIETVLSVQRVVSNNVLLNPDESKLVYGYRELDTGKRQTLMNMLAFLNSQQQVPSSPKIVQSNVGGNNALTVGDNNSVTVGR